MQTPIILHVIAKFEPALSQNMNKPLNESTKLMTLAV